MIRVYAPRIFYQNVQWLKAPGPVLLACNHPNSFLDGMILTTLMDAPLYSLARGDAFRGKKVARWLNRLKLLPVYRLSEGAENLSQNYDTFRACIDCFRQGNSVLIFSEGGCVNEWHLRPLRKGTARLAFTALDAGIPLTVVPVGLNYDSFRTFGKEVHVLFGQPLDLAGHQLQEGDGNRLRSFNRELQSQLSNLVYEIPPSNDVIRGKYFRAKSALIPLALAIPALTGFLLHLPLYVLSWIIAWKYFRHNDHYDSVLHSVFLLGYPLLILTYAVVLFFTKPLYALFALALPLSCAAWILAAIYLRGKKNPPADPADHL